MPGKFELKKSGDQYMFNLEAANGQVLLTSERYTRKEGAKNGIDSVKTNAPSDNRYDQHTASNGSPYFVLKATKGEVIGTSEIYSSASARDNGIESVKTNAPSASTEDLT